MKMTTPILYTKSLAGHRAEYLAFSLGILGGRRGGNWEIFTSAEPVVFLMVEESFALYFFAGIFRSLLGWRTTGLLFRPKPVIERKSIRLQMKAWALRQLKKVRGVKTLSIVPVPLEPQIAQYVDGWIYDFQLWDVTPEQQRTFHAVRTSQADTETTVLFQGVRSASKGRKILIALGVQNDAKGISMLAEAASLEEFSRDWLCVVAGAFDKNNASDKERLIAAGALIEDRYISEREMLELYAAADAVWCVYSADYDQASGILGRSMQYGVPALVRKESLSHKLCVLERARHIAIDTKSLRIGSWPEDGSESDAIAVRNRMKEYSISVIQSAINFR